MDATCKPSYSLPLWEKNSPPTAREEILVSHMTTPPGEYPGLNALRLSGAFQVESETDFTNIASQSSPLKEGLPHGRNSPVIVRRKTQTRGRGRDTWQASLD